MSNRHAFIENLKRELDEWDAELAALEEQATAAKAELKTGYQEEVASLRRRRDEAMLKLAQMREATDDAWDDLKQGSETAWSDMKAAFSRARTKFQS